MQLAMLSATEGLIILHAILRILGFTLPAVLAGAFNPAAAQAATSRCSAAVIVRFAGDILRPAAPVVARIARARRVQLQFLREVGGGLFLYRLSASGDALACDAGIARLQRDPRIASADPDAHRQAH